jgi:hypothetical protein
MAILIRLKNKQGRRNRKPQLTLKAQRARRLRRLRLAALALQSLIDEEHRRQEEHVGSRPRQRVAIADAMPQEEGHYPQADGTPRQHLHHAAHHREVAVAEALNGIAEDGEQAEHRIKIARDAHEHGGIGHDFLLARLHEKHHHIVGKGIDDEEGEHEIDEHDFDRCFQTCRDALQLSRSNVLSAIGRHRYADILKDAREQIFHSLRGGEGCHVGRAEGIVGTLKHDDADACDGELKPHRDAVVEQMAHHVVVILPLLASGHEHLHPPVDIPYAEPYRESLREQRGKSRSLNAEAEPEDEHHVEQDVHQRRGDEEIERLFGVAQRADEARQQVVAHGEGDGDEVEQQENPRVVEDFRRRVHHLQDAGAEEAREERDDHGQHGGYAQRVGHVSPHLGIVLGSEALSHRNGKARARAVAEPHDEKHDGGARSHSCQRAHAYPAPHDGGVDDEVHLLEDVAQYQG